MKKVVFTLLLVFVFLFVNLFQMVDSLTSFAVDTIYGEPPVGSAQYDEWKKNYVEGNTFAFFGGINVYAASVSSNKMYNSYLELAVANNARYTVGTSGGNPDVLTDNYKKLLYGHASPGTSYIISDYKSE